MQIAIVGAGIGGLTLALELEASGFPCKLYESVSQFAPVGVGINLLPHATSVLADLGLLEDLSACAVETKESAFFNRFGQLISSEAAGRAAGYDTPQFSIHRGDLQAVLLRAVHERLGEDVIAMGHRCIGFTQDENGIKIDVEVGSKKGPVQVRADAVIACDGVHSVIRKQLNPDEGEPKYSGVNMWRGVTVMPPFLTGASMVRAGWLNPGKLVAYPVRNNVDGQGNQLVNWVAEVETPHHLTRDWNRRGQISDFIKPFADWHFDWLDVPEMIRKSEVILEYPMVDQDPLDHWTSGRVTLLGDAAHPMYPRGSNGAGQAILDARALRVALEAYGLDEGLVRYEQERLATTARIVETNRSTPPDILLKEIVDRTGDKPFTDIAEIISAEEIAEISERYKQIAGYRQEDVNTQQSTGS